MDEDDEDYIPGLHDDRSVPRVDRIARYAEHLREWVDFELAIQIAATNSILMIDMEHALGNFDKKYDSLKAVKESIEISAEAGMEGLKIGRRSLDLLAMEREDRKSKLSRAGTDGAKARHDPSNKLKEWALLEGAKTRGSDKDIARVLAGRIPEQFAKASKDPERLIYDTLRSKRSEQR